MNKLFANSKLTRADVITFIYTSSNINVKTIICRENINKTA